MSSPKTIAFVISLALSAGMLTRDAYGQAWVGTGGSLSVATDYSFAPSDRVIEEGDVSIPGNVSNHSMTLSLEYTPIDNLEFSASIPLVITKYAVDPNIDPNTVFPPHGRYDDGDRHTFFQDFRLNTRYMVLAEPVAVSPHLGVSVPMTNYETVGYAGGGRGLNQLHLGISVGKYFTEIIPNFYVHALYEFSWVERYKTGFPETEAFGQNKSEIKTLVGYFITDNFEVNLGLDKRIAHGGFDFLDYNAETTTDIVRFYHDPLLAESFTHVGGGASYQFTETIRAYTFLRLWLSGKNTRDAHVFGAGVSWDIM